MWETFKVGIASICGFDGEKWPSSLRSGRASEIAFNQSGNNIDRMLKPIREKAKPRKRRRAKPKTRTLIPVRTFSDWDGPPPGYFEIDFVLHCGGSISGSYISTFSATNVCSGWIECLPLLAREQSLVVESLEVLRQQLPFPILGIDSDNDSVFINESLFEYTKKHDIEFTRSRAYRKNDQAWIEQKNGAVIRRFLGYKRYSGVVAGQAIAHLYQAIRLYVNFFQPSFKLKERIREGARVKRRYEKPATPCERLLAHPNVDSRIKDKLRLIRDKLDPIALLNQIRNDQSAIAALADYSESMVSPERRNLEQFLSQLPILWKAGEIRPTHRKVRKKRRYYRTRKDPFESKHNICELIPLF